MEALCFRARAPSSLEGGRGGTLLLPPPAWPFCTALPPGRTESLLLSRPGPGWGGGVFRLKTQFLRSQGVTVLFLLFPPFPPLSLSLTCFLRNLKSLLTLYGTLVSLFKHRQSLSLFSRCALGCILASQDRCLPSLGSRCALGFALSPSPRLLCVCRALSECCPMSCTRAPRWL